MNYSNTNTLQNIKSEAQGILPGCRVMLFGSRARGEASANSDYDILVILNEKMEIIEKRRYQSLINKALAKMGILADIIIQSEDEIIINRQLPGHVIHYAMQEATQL